jgi:dimethylargininase
LIVAVIALTRRVPDALAACELTHLERVPIDVARARAQHAEYERVLASLGCQVVTLPEAPDLADSVFVEDTAIMLDEIAIITRPGAASRQAETAAIASTLGAFRQLQFLSAPATLDGGDVLRLGWTLYVGIGSRTNAAGAQQLREFVSPYGYQVRSVAVDGCLHLKSAVTEVAPGVVVINRKWVDSQMFPNHAIIEVDPAEPAAANVLRIGEAIVCGAAYPRTNARLSAVGRVHTVDLSELAKAEGAVTCCSVVFLESGPRTGEWTSHR